MKGKAPQEVTTWKIYSLTGTTSSDSIIVARRGDFEKLDKHQGYIEWLFPNFYGSNFNLDCYKLEKEEAKIFRESQIIAERLIRAYTLIYEFFGFELADRQTGQVQRAHNFVERATEVLVNHPHNLLKIRRLLTHMNNVGFKRYAHALVDFLEYEIYCGIGYSTYVKNPDDFPIVPDKFPLSHLVRGKQFATYRAYGADATNQERSANCISSDEDDYADSIYFKTYE
eukprot:TRINITY_DN1720_c0_g1_i1.p1 TRINITY_DN1720_c0_g1~~TRINITY_DN1720_c0_g1_i1.p1  ORF type:complete len:227 (-),score=17.00 TRINITY_DN1720_c0_g1_i1:25-705(-)